MSELITVRQKPLTFEAMRFPNGGKTQGKVADWVESHGMEMSLFDGNVQQLDEPADDGSMWRWIWSDIRKPGDFARNSMSVMVGDYIIHEGDGNFRVVKPWDIDEFYEVLDHA